MNSYNMYSIRRDGVDLFVLETRAWFLAGVNVFNSEQDRKAYFGKVQNSAMRMTGSYLYLDTNLYTGGILDYYFTGAVFSKLDNKEVYVA